MLVRIPLQLSSMMSPTPSSNLSVYFSRFLFPLFFCVSVSVFVCHCQFVQPHAHARTHAPTYINAHATQSAALAFAPQISGRRRSCVPPSDRSPAAHHPCPVWRVRVRIRRMREHAQRPAFASAAVCSVWPICGSVCSGWAMRCSASDRGAADARADGNSSRRRSAQSPMQTA